MALLETEQLTSGYDEVQVLWGADVRLEAGQFTALVGANGAGKTTLVRTVMGLCRPWGGCVHFQGRDVTHLPAHAKAELGLVLVPEGRQLFTDMTVEENLLMGASPKRARANHQANRERAFEMFPRLKERQHQHAGTLSGGEQQMLAVARGLMADPVVLLLDELSLGLAPALVAELFQNLTQLRDTGLTVLLVEQNVQLALATCDRAYVLSNGRVELEGDADELAEDPRAQAAYLGMACSAYAARIAAGRFRP